MQTDREHLEEAQRLRTRALEEGRRGKELMRENKFTEARRLKQLSADLHVRASDLYFSYYNGSACPSNTIDLHQLTRDEALSRAIDFLRSKNRGIVSIITGRGVHSRDGVGIIRDYIEKYLQRTNYYCYRVPRFNEGIIEVNLDMSISRES